MKPRVMTISGIRPDFVRMSEVFRKFDENFDHVLVHTNQHFSEELSGVFFRDLEIRKPDYNLGIGGPGKEHFHQQAELCVKAVELCRELKPDLVFFLGDSNSVLAAVPLKKEGFKIAHIEAGMRSGDRRMFEETNRIVCDHVSDLLFVYHADYRDNLLKEGIPYGQIHIVGNTIVEPFRKMGVKKAKHSKHVALDVHRRENFTDPKRLESIIGCSSRLGKKWGLPVKMLAFGQTMEAVKKAGIFMGDIEVVPLMGYKEHLEFQAEAKVIVSDSGTDQEQPALLGVPVLVPRDFTERPQSYEAGCSFQMNVGPDLRRDLRRPPADEIDACLVYLDNHPMWGTSADWLGDGKTSQKILDATKAFLGVA